MNTTNNGYVTLLSVLLLGAVGMAVTTSLLLSGIGNSRTGLAHQHSHQARALANACAEEGLEQIRNLISYTGSGNLTLGGGTCSYTVTNQGGENRTVTAQGTMGTAVRKVKVIINDINPRIAVVTWEEVADF